MLVLTALTLYSCENSLLRGDDTFYTLDIETVPFDTITVKDIFNIELMTGSRYSIRLEGNERSVGRIKAEIGENTLSLEDNNLFRWLPDYKEVRLTISFPSLRRLNLLAPATLFSADTLYLEDFSVYALGRTGIADLMVKANNIRFITEMENFGQYTLRGYSRYADLWHRGSSRLDASDLVTEYLWITNNSMADCYVNARRRLTVVINHYGNVHYKGNPDELIINEMSSRGRLFRYDD